MTNWFIFFQIATLPILLPDNDTGQLNEEQEVAARQIVRHVCVAYRRYLEAHLVSKVEIIRRSQLRPNDRNTAMLPAQPSYKVCKVWYYFKISQYFNPNTCKKIKNDW